MFYSVGYLVCYVYLLISIPVRTFTKAGISVIFNTGVTISGCGTRVYPGFLIILNLTPSIVVLFADGDVIILLPYIIRFEKSVAIYA